MSIRLIKGKWFKFTVLAAYIAIVFTILKIYHVDYKRLCSFDIAMVRGNLNAFGVWIVIGYLALYVLRPLVFFPATILSIIGGLIFGPTWGMVIVLLGAMLSAVTEFLIARRYGQSVMKYFIGMGHLPHLDVARRHGFKTVFLIRLIPNLAFDIQNFVLGSCDIAFGDYFFATLLGILPITFVYVYLGHSLLVLERLSQLMYVLILLSAFLFIARRLSKRGLTTKIEKTGDDA